MANWITLSRYPLLLAFTLMFYFGNQMVQIISVPLLFISLMLDSVDGIVARATGKASLLGSVLDIALDRAYELSLWIILADKGAISLAIPLIVIIRTTLTDALRSIGVQEGQRPFDQHKSQIGQFLVKSKWMRSSYGLSKVAAFCGLALGIALSNSPQGSVAYVASETLLAIFGVVAWIAVALCLIRGMPVVVGAIRRSEKV